MLHGCYVTHGSVRATLRRKEAVKPALCIMVLVYERYWATFSTWIYRALPVFPDVKYTGTTREGPPPLYILVGQELERILEHGHLQHFA